MDKKINDIVESWMVEYISDKNSFLKDWTGMVTRHNEVFRAVKEAGDSSIYYFPKAENKSPHGRCGTCFQRMVRNMSHYYAKNILSEDSLLIRQRIKGRPDEFAQPAPRNVESVWFQMNDNALKVETVEVTPVEVETEAPKPKAKPKAKRKPNTKKATPKSSPNE